MPEPAAYDDCKARLHGVKFDDDQQEVYFPIDDRSAMVVDYDKGSADMKLLVFPGDSLNLYDFSAPGADKVCASRVE